MVVTHVMSFWSPIGERLHQLRTRGRARAGALACAAAIALILVACGGDGNTAAAAVDDPRPTPTPLATVISTSSDAGLDFAPAAVAPAAPAPQSAPLPQMSALDVVAAQEQVLANVYAAALPSVVYVSVAQRIPANAAGFFGRQDPGESYRFSGGSGFVWDELGHILTNYHVVEDADFVRVAFSDGTELDAEVLGGDGDSDLAVLKVDAAGRALAPLPRAGNDDVRVGQLALAIGSPFGQNFTLTGGIVSALGRTIRSSYSAYSIPKVIQTDTPINPGNSGGPLLDRLGRVMGINTQILTDSGGNDGVGFAVPIDIAKRVVPALIEKGHYDHSWLGISGATVNADAADRMGLPVGTRGVQVITLADGGPAEDAGLLGADDSVVIRGRELALGGDVITAVNGTPVNDMHDLISYLIEHTQPEDVVTLEVVRGAGETVEVAVTLGFRPDN